MRKIQFCCFIVVALALNAWLATHASAEADSGLRDIGDIRVRDPFILTDVPNGRYILVANSFRRRHV